MGHPELVGGGVTSLHSHTGGGGIGYEHTESDAESPTTSTSWQTKLTHMVLVAGTYLVQWAYELSGSSVAYHTRSQVLYNAVEIGNVQFEPEDISPDEWAGIAGMKLITLTAGNTIKINWCSENTGGTATIRRAKVFLLKL